MIGFEASLRKQFPGIEGQENSVADSLAGLNRALGGERYVEDFRPESFAETRRKALDGPNFPEPAPAPRIPLSATFADSDGRMPRLVPHQPTRFKPLDKNLLMRRIREFVDTELYHKHLMQQLNELRGY